jgi:hypothetical protein
MSDWEKLTLLRYITHTLAISSYRKCLPDIEKQKKTSGWVEIEASKLLGMEVQEDKAKGTIKPL